MMEFQEKRRVKKWLYSKTVLFVLVIILALLLNAIWKIYQKQELTKDNLTKAQDALMELQGRENSLSDSIAKLQTAAGEEAEIREKYGLVKPGEEIIKVVGDGDADADDSTSTETDLWEDMANWFK